MFHLFGFPSWKSSDPKIIVIQTYIFENVSQKKAPEKSRWPFWSKKPLKMGNYTIWGGGRGGSKILGEAGKQEI